MAKKPTSSARNRARPAAAPGRDDPSVPPDSELATALLDGDEVLVVVYDSRGKIERFNRACENLSGFTADEVRGKPLGSVLLIAEEVDAFRGWFEQMSQSGRFPARCEHHWGTKNGQRRWIAWSATPIRDNIGRIKHIVMAGVDMTERHPDGRALIEGQARLAGIIDSAMDAVITVDSRQIIKLFNRAAEKMFLCPAAEAIGQPLEKFIPQRHRDAHHRHVEKFGESNVTDRAMGAQRAISALRSNGEEFLIEASISQVDVGGTRLYTAMVRDVTVRNRAAEDLRAAEARFRAIYDNAAVGIMMIDPAGVILQANAACARMLGYSAEELHGMPYDHVTHPHDLQRTAEHNRPLLEGLSEREEYEKRYVTREGNRVWARVIFSAVVDASAKPQYFIKLIEDITRRKRNEARARRLRAENAAVLDRLRTLTDREREVLWLMVDGQATKVIAMELGTSPKTIDVHRGRVMEKMHAESVAQLVQMVMPIRKMPEAAGGQPTD